MKTTDNKNNRINISDQQNCSQNHNLSIRAIYSKNQLARSQNLIVTDEQTSVKIFTAIPRQHLFKIHRSAPQFSWCVGY